MKIQHSILIISVAFTVSSCFSSGSASLRNATPASISKSIIKGRTTEKEILAMYGEPTNIMLSDSGSKTFMYQHWNSRPGVENFIPVVGGMVSVSHSNNKQLNILFSPSGIVRNYSFTNPQTTTSGGIFNMQ